MSREGAGNTGLGGWARVRRSLAHFSRQNFAVALGAAVAAAVLTGALVVGDSVKGSLRDLALERLGRIDAALTADRLLREDLAADLAAATGREAAPALLVQGSAVHGESGARASGVAVVGVDESFSALYPASPPLDLSRREGQIFPSVALNAGLADELGAEVGDAVLLSFRSYSEIPEETLLGRTDGAGAVERLRLSVVEILPDASSGAAPGEGGMGSFSLVAQQSRPLNAFLERSRLARGLEQEADRANALLVAVSPDGEEEAVSDDPAGEADLAALEETLGKAATLEDLGLRLLPSENGWVVESRELILPPEVASALEEILVEEGLGGPGAPRKVFGYLANEIRVEGAEGEGASVPYSSVAALSFPETTGEDGGGLRLVGGTPAPPLAADELYLNAWTAEQLAAELGDAVTLTYFEVGERDRLTEKDVTLTLAGVVAMEGLGADASLLPALPGISDADDMGEWDSPFPVDLSRVRPVDEEYWDRWGAAPKAFLPLEVGQRLWKSRFGDLTSLRVSLPTEGGAGSRLTTDEVEAALTAGLIERLGTEGFGLGFRPVRARALEASGGATDFAQLFLAFSFFLIVSAALLVGLLFRLGVEQRAREVGLLLATGFPLKKVRRGFLVEGGVLAALGALAGLAGAVGYGALMLHGLRTWWVGAVGAPVLRLHIEPATLALGWAVSVVVVLLAVVLALRTLRKVPVPALLLGSVEPPRRGRAGRLPRWIALGFGALGLALLAAMLLTESSGAGPGGGSSPALAFGTGTCLLVAGLAGFLALGRGRRRRANALAGGSLFGMASRNSARAAGRSVLAAGLVATATFMIVTVGANRGHRDVDVEDPASGAGGFTLMAESDVPLTQDLERPEDLARLGFPPEAEEALAGTEIFPLRLLPGEDASCLNLYRPAKPRVLGVPAAMAARGGFSFQSLEESLTGGADARDNPWQLLGEDLGPGVVPAFADVNSAQWILKKGLGDEIVLEDGRGEELRLRLVGLLAKGIFQSELLISEEAFLEHFPGRTGSAFFLIDAPAERQEEISETLEAGLADFGFDAVSTAARLAAYDAVESTYMSTFQTLGGLGLLLGTVGLGIILLRNVLERRGELATLRAFGYRRRRLSAMVVAENAFLLLVGLGLGAVSALVAVAPRLLQAAGEVPWLELAVTLLLVFLVGLAASLAAVAGTSRVPLLPALKER